MTGWDGCTLEPNAIVRWLECHPGTGSWAQVAGTVLAIAFAALAPFVHDWWRDKRQADERKRQVRSIAYETLALADKIKSIYMTVEHMERFLSHSRLPEKLSVLLEALDRAPWSEMGDHTVFSLGQSLKAATIEMGDLYEKSFVEDQRGVRFVSTNGRIPVIAKDCAERMIADATSVVNLIGTR